MTGIYTGRSPKDKVIVMDENSKDTVWWTSEEFENDNRPATQETWEEVKRIAVEELSNKRLFVVDTFCGTNEDTRMSIRFICEVAWQAHFVKNMFIRPTEEELENFEPDFVVYNAAKAKVENYKELGLNSETVAMFNITSREQVILNTWYGGEMKKGMFSIMNYFLPLKVLLQCTVLQTQTWMVRTQQSSSASPVQERQPIDRPKRLLVGDDEHGWDDNGIFNFEGCYVKVIDLDKSPSRHLQCTKRDTSLNVTLMLMERLIFPTGVTEIPACLIRFITLKYRAPSFRSPRCKARNILISRRIWCTSASICSYSGTDTVLFPVRFHS